MNLSSIVQHEIIMAAHKAANEEACGFIVNNEQVIVCKNIHDCPETNFAIAAEDYVMAEDCGEITAVFHSHTHGKDRFSPHDVEACKATNIPWVMYNRETNNFLYADPRMSAPIVGRQWVYGIHDCYALVRDYYHQSFGIDLDDFKRGDEEEWQNPEWKMFDDNFASQGFTEKDKSAVLKHGNILMFKLLSSSVTHVGVVDEAGCGFYHHMGQRYSEHVEYNGFWAKMTTKVLCHKELQ